jgi:DNA phosphorothioation-dependent restriction protein DptH
MITSSHIHLLGRALANVVGQPEKGSVSFLRCLPSDIVETLASDGEFRVPNFKIYGVTDRRESQRRLITADRAVELREDKDEPVLLLIDTHRAGAGLDGIYSAGREIGERELLVKANELARKELGPGYRYFSRFAVTMARGIGQHNLITPWQEFDFLVGAADLPGAALTRLGLWPVVSNGGPPDRDSLELSRALVNRLLVERGAGLTPQDKVSALMLDDPGGSQAVELEEFLRRAADVSWGSAVDQLLEHPNLWVGALKPRFASEELQEIELVSWMKREKQVHKWSGLRFDSTEAIPKFILDRNATSNRDGPRLEVRWNTKPAQLPKGAVEYQVSVVSGSDQILSSRAVPHKEKGPQKTAFTLEDFEELDESARFEAIVRVTAVGHSQVLPADSDEFILEFGIHEGTVSSTAGRVVRSFVEGAVTVNGREDFDTEIRDLQLHAHQDKQGYITWRSPSGRSFRVLRPSLIREVEQDWTDHRGAVGRWSVRVRADGSPAEALVFHPFERGECGEELWDRLSRASRRLCEEVGDLGLLAVVQGSRVQWVDDYLLSWAAALEQGRSDFALANTVEVRTLSGRTIGLIVLPAHPVRLAWHAAYDQLAAHCRYEEGTAATSVASGLNALDSAHFPAVLPGLESGQGFIFGDTLGFHAVAMIADQDVEPKAAISVMATCLASETQETTPDIGRHSVEVLAREIGHYLDCHTRPGFDGRETGPNLLYVHAIKPGDGMIVGRALGRVLASRPSEADEDGDRVESDLCFVLDLFPSKGQEAIAGRFLLDVARRRRAGAGTVELDDRWMLETVQRPGDIPFPRLRWARRDINNPSLDFAHLALAFDIFASRLEAVPADTLTQEPRPLHAYGMIAAMERQVALDAEPSWRVFLPLKTEGDKHPANRTITDRLIRLQEAVARATAIRLGGTESCWPVLTTRLPHETQQAIRDLHRFCDWVVTADRNVCIEYFDSPKERRAIYDAYVIDCVPERTDLGSLQLVTSTSNLDEVRNLFDEMLLEMGLSSSARNCEFLLWHLKGLSGRLAIRLAGEGTKAGELVALALVHAACAKAEVGSPIWLPLADGFFVPLDEIGDILPPGDADGTENRRADLVFVSAGSRRPLEFHFVEVKFRRHLRVARSTELLEKVMAQTAAVRKRWEEHFFGAKSSIVLGLRRSALARLLYFYLDKARRHYLLPEAHERLRREIDKLLVQGDSYEPAVPERSEHGYVFCPELRTVEFERLYLAGYDTANLFLVGISHLPDTGPVVSTPPIREESIVEPVGASTETDGGQPQPAPVEGDGRAGGAELGLPVDVALGKNATTEELVPWHVSIKSNPHLMIVGLPGMGKTTCLVNLCRQLQAGGITPVVFSYHQDIDEKLEAVCGKLNAVDFDGLGFNPLQVAADSPHAHVDVSSELRDIFGAIFPDLGDIQTEEIRQAIKQSYVDLGWGGKKTDAALPIPPFQTFFDILRAKPKPNQGLMARLAELSDYGFFKSGGTTRSLLDFDRPSVIRIHRTSNDLLQRAFASFVLYSVYKDMFKRGPQTALTHAIVFDEAHRASRLKLLPTMAKECRKFGISLVLASQEARDFDSSLFSAIASYLALRVTEHDAKTIAKMVGSSNIEKRVVDRLKQLGKYTALFFTEGSTRPVTIALLGDTGSVSR